MTMLRKLGKRVFVAMMGNEVRPHRILRGLPIGYRIFVSPAEHLGYLLGTSEPYLQNIIQQYVDAGDTVYDIGANIGYVAMSLARQVGPKGAVVAFEPVPENIVTLRKNIEINNLGQVRVIESAAWDRCGEALIRTTGNLAMASLVWHDRDSLARELLITIVTIDSLVQSGKLDPPRFVKIDVEGAEGHALDGMRETIRMARPCIFLECSDAGRSRSWSLLRGLDYRCESAISRKTIDQFDEYRHSDFLWLPE